MKNAYQMDECSWYAADTQEDAIAAYVRDTGQEPEDDYPELMDDAWMDKPMKCFDADEGEPNLEKPRREWAAELTEPGFLCGTEW